MSVETTSDEALVRFYENIRQWAEADWRISKTSPPVLRMPTRCKWSGRSETVRGLVELGLKARK